MDYPPFIVVWVCMHAQWSHHLMFVMIRDCLFNSTSPHVGIHLHSLSGVNGVLHGSLWKSLKTPDLMWCVYSRQQYCIWLICCLFCLLYACFCFSSFCHVFFLPPPSNLNGFVDEMPCQSLVCLFQELSLHVSASIREYRCFPFVALFFHSEMKRRGNGICSHSVVCVVNNVCCNFLARYNKSKLLHTLFDHVSSVNKLVNILFQ